MVLSPAAAKSARLSIRYRAFILPLILLVLAGTFYGATSMTWSSRSIQEHQGRLAAFRAVPESAPVFVLPAAADAIRSEFVSDATPAQSPKSSKSREHLRDTAAPKARPQVSEGVQRTRFASIGQQASQPGQQASQPISRWLRSALRLRQQPDEHSDWTACMPDGSSNRPFGVKDFLAARPAQ